MEGKKLVIKRSIEDYKVFENTTFYLVDEKNDVKQIIRNDHLLYKQIENSNDILYVCKNKKCPFQCNVGFDIFMNIEWVKDKNFHSCDKQITVQDHLKEHILKDLSIEICLKVPFLSPGEVEQVISISRNDFNRLWNKVTYQKKKMKIYTKIEMLLDDKNYYLIHPSSTKNIVIFYRNWSFDILAKSQVIFMDGTWLIKLSSYTQMYIISCSLNGVYFTTFLIMMKFRTKNDYLNLFKILEDEIKKKNKNFKLFGNGVQVICDFEQAVILALKEFQVVPTGCSFHMKQAIYRYLDRNGLGSEKELDKVSTNDKEKKLTNEEILKFSESIKNMNVKDINYQSQIEFVNYFCEKKLFYFRILFETQLKVREWIKILTNIIYLNKSFINNNLLMFIFKKIDKNIDDNYKQEISKFQNYYFRTWFSETCRFQNWNVFNSDFRSNGVAENINKNLNIGLQTNPNLQKLLFKIKNVFYSNERKIIGYNNKEKIENGSRFTKKQNILLKVLDIMLFEEEIDVITFLQLCG